MQPRLTPRCTLNGVLKACTACLQLIHQQCSFELDWGWHYFLSKKKSHKKSIKWFKEILYSFYYYRRLGDSYMCLSAYDIKKIKIYLDYFFKMSIRSEPVASGSQIRKFLLLLFLNLFSHLKGTEFTTPSQSRSFET